MNLNEFNILLKSKERVRTILLSKATLQQTQVPPLSYELGTKRNRRKLKKEHRKQIKVINEFKNAYT